MDHSCVLNSVTPLMVNILRLPFFPKQNSYVMKIEFLVDRRVKVPISLGNYEEIVWFEVFPIDVGLILLGILWFQNHVI